MKNWGSVGERFTRRWSVVVVAACALAVTTLSVGGAVAMLSDEQRQRDMHTARQDMPVVPVVPAIVTEDAAFTPDDTSPEAVDRLLGEARARSAETVTAGEAVYAAASERSMSKEALRKLRGALDATSKMLDGELAQDASVKERERMLRQLESARATVLDAAAEITSVRHVPAGELVSTTTKLAVPDDESPAGEPVFKPNPEPDVSPEPEPSDDTSDEPEPSTDPGDDSSGDPSDDPSVPPATEPADEPSPETTDDTSPEPSDEASSTDPKDDSDKESSGGLLKRKAPSDDPSAGEAPSESPVG